MIQEDVDHQENPTGPVALIGDGTFYCPFVIVDDPSPPETAAPPAEVADSKEVIGQAVRVGFSNVQIISRLCPRFNMLIYRK